VSAGFWSDATVREALGLEAGDPAISYRRISTDSRSIDAGDLYLALRGDRFDGHDFLVGAFGSGALAAVVSDPELVPPAGATFYRVGDTLEALHRLAAFRRDRIQARFVGVVGSNGKTTTKELIRSVLETRYVTYATQGNLNNQIGVPLTLLGVPEGVDVVVVEMGTDRPGEIRALTHLVRPDAVVVTSIGEEHLEMLGDLEGVLQEEMAVLDGLAPDGRAFVAEEPEILPEVTRERLGAARVRVAGIGSGADLRPDGGGDGIRVLEDGSTAWQWRGIDVRLPIPGRINVRNALLALGVGLDMGVSAEDAIRGLRGVKLPTLRGEWHRYGDVRVLADCYNANPPSLAAAVDLLATLPGAGRRVVVLGTMRELGSASDRLHAEAAEAIAARLGSGLDLIVATGEFARVFEPYAPRLGDRLRIARDPVDAYRDIRHLLSGVETILLKASRGERLERWLPLLEEDFGAADATSANDGPEVGLE